MIETEKNKLIENNIYWFAFTAIFILAFIIRFTLLNIHSLWMDESLSIWHSLPHRDILWIMKESARQSQPPAYEVLRYWSMAIFGITEITVKLPSLIAGVIAVPFLGILGTQLSNRRVGIIAMFWLAICPFHIYYTAESRPYALLCMATIIYMCSLIVFDRKPNLWKLLALIMTIFFGYSINIFFSIVAGVSILCLCICQIYNRKNWVKLSLIILLHILGAVFAYWLYSQTGLLSIMLNKEKYDQGAFGFFSFHHVFSRTIQSFYFVHYHFDKKEWLAYITTAILFFNFVFDFRKNLILKLLAIAFMLAIIFQGWIFSVRTGVVFKPRYVIYVLPFMILGCSYFFVNLSEWVVRIIVQVTKTKLTPKSISLISLTIAFLFVTTYQIVAGKKGTLYAYNKYDKSPWRAICKKTGEYAKKQPLYLVSNVRSDFSGHLYFQKFNAVSNVFFLKKGQESLQLNNFIKNKIKFSYVENISVTNDATLFERIPYYYGYPHINMWVTKDVPEYINAQSIERYRKSFGKIIEPLLIKHNEQYVNKLIANNEISKACESLTNEQETTRDYSLLIKLLGLTKNISSDTQIRKELEKLWNLTPQTNYIFDLTPLYTIGVKKMRKGVTYDNKPVIIQGTNYPKSISIHPMPEEPCFVEYEIGGLFKSFSANLAITGNGKVSFLVYVDDKLLYKSPEITKIDKPIPLTLDVSGKNTLKLVIDKGKNYYGDQAVWCDPKVIK